MRQFGLAEIISAGPKNVTYKILKGGAAGGILKGAYAEIMGVVKAEEKKKSVHPFKVGEQFEGRIFENGRYSNATYEIIKATNSTIKLKRVGSDDKPITRKPSFIEYTSEPTWVFSIDDSYGNTFYKKPEATE